MKTRSLLVSILLLITFLNSFSRYAISPATFNSTSDGQSLRFTDPCNDSTHPVFTDLLNYSVDGTPSNFYLQSKFDLILNCPDPFNPSTINYNLSFGGIVNLNIFNMPGEQFLAIVNEQQSAGYYSATINAGRIASGVYYNRLRAGNEEKNFAAT